MRHIPPSSPSDGSSAAADFDSQDRFLIALASGQREMLPRNVFDAGDTERIVARIREHRLEGRCRRLFTDLRACGYHDDLLEAVNAACDATSNDFRRNSAAAAQMAGHFGADFGVVVKGFSTYLLTGDPALLRCGDLDIILKDSGPIIGYLLGRGFKQTRPPFLHEIGEYTRAGVEVDLQWGFPVSRHPQTPPAADEAPLTAAGLPDVEYIDADFVLRYSRVVTLEGSAIRVPQPELAALIAASHGYMNYTNIWSISHRTKAWLRLSELADIEELRALPDFSNARFRDLVARFQAHDVVAWANWIWLRLTGRPMFDGVAPTTTSSAPPCCLWWNLWLRMDTPSALLLREAWYPMAVVHPLLEQSIGARPMTGSAMDEMPLLSQPDGGKGSLRFFGAIRDGILRLAIHHDNRPKSLCRIRVDLGSDAKEIAVDTKQHQAGGGERGAEVRDWSEPLEYVVEPGVVRMAFDVARHGADCGYAGLAVEEDGSILASTVFPFRLAGPHL